MYGFLYCYNHLSFWVCLIPRILIYYTFTFLKNLISAQFAFSLHLSWLQLRNCFQSEKDRFYFGVFAINFSLYFPLWGCYSMLFLYFEIVISHMVNLMIVPKAFKNNMFPIMWASSLIYIHSTWPVSVIIMYRLLIQLFLSSCSGTKR